MNSLIPKIRYWRHVVTNSFWFVPTLMTIGGAALAVISQSSINTSWLAANLITLGLLPADSDTSRLILSTIVGSIITVTTLVFSMTLIALSQAAQQLGPRLLGEFRGSRTNQIVLGAFVATFVHALLTLTMAADPVPVVSVFISVVMVLICFGLLIFFIHHVARSMEADNVIAVVNQDIARAIASSFTPREKAEEEQRGRDDGAHPDLNLSDQAFVYAPSSGYIQTVDYDRLVELAVEADVVIQMKHRPGHFVMAGAPIGTVQPSPDDDGELEISICGAIVVGETRTSAQDVEFSIKAMVEVALRALSPGINDIFTALTCIDRLGGSVAMAMTYVMPNAELVDEEGCLRVIHRPVTFDGLMDSAFNEIRQNLDAKVAGLIRLIDTFDALTPFIVSLEHHDAIREHTDKAERMIKSTIVDPDDLADAQQRLTTLRRHLADAREKLEG